MFYWLFTAVVLAAILIGFYIYNYFDKLSTTRRNLERIQNKWGRPVNARRNFKLIAAYLNGFDGPGKSKTGERCGHHSRGRGTGRPRYPEFNDTRLAVGH